MNELWFCPLSRLYFRKAPCNPLLSMHADINVGDVMVPSDIADHELGYDLAAERYELFESARP